MSSGTPDYSLATKTEITASSILQAVVDITAQSIGNLDVDIVAQALSELNVDIVAQSLTNLSVDLAAQTLTQLDIDIIAQTIGDLNIDVNAQTLAEIINRPKYGALQLVNYTNETMPADWTEIADITAQGVIYGGFVSTNAVSSHENDRFRFTIDGERVFSNTYAYLNTWQTFNELVEFCSLVVFDDTNYNYSFSLPGMITFESTVIVEYENTYEDNPIVRCEITYATI